MRGKERRQALRRAAGVVGPYERRGRQKRGRAGDEADASRKFACDNRKAMEYSFIMPQKSRAVKGVGSWMR